MKKILLFSALLIGFTMCHNPSDQTAAQAKTTISIYYFHGTNRCGNCMAIEENTRKALELYFSKELKEGVVTFTSVDVDEATNKSLVEKCNASAMTLYFLKTDGDGKETTNDYTEFAINTARAKPDAYMQGIRDRVVEQMK